MEEILTVSTNTEVPQSANLLKAQNESENEVKPSTPPSSEKENKYNSSTSSETEGMSPYPNSSDVDGMSTNPTSSEIEVKFIAQNSSTTEVERNTTPSSKSVTKSLNLNAQFASEDIRYKKTEIKTPISRKGAVKKKV